MAKKMRPEPFFLAEDRALDFLNSTASPRGIEIEWIRDGRDLLAWLETAALVAAPVVARFRKNARRQELDAVAARARELREWFRTFVGDHAGRPLRSKVLADLAPINRVLAGDCSYRQLEVRSPSNKNRGTSGPALRWRRDRRWHSVDALLLPLAEAMGDMICRADFRLVKKCAGPTCTMWFHDTSKNRTRRWCSMAVCGNRAKAAAHRARGRAARIPGLSEGTQ